VTLRLVDPLPHVSFDDTVANQPLSPPPPYHLVIWLLLCSSLQKQTRQTWVLLFELFLFKLNIPSLSINIDSSIENVQPQKLSIKGKTNLQNCRNSFSQNWIQPTKKQLRIHKSLYCNYYCSKYLSEVNPIKISFFIFAIIHYVIRALPSSSFSMHNLKIHQKIPCKREEGKQTFFCKQTQPALWNHQFCNWKTIYSMCYLCASVHWHT